MKTLISILCFTALLVSTVFAEVGVSVIGASVISKDGLKVKAQLPFDDEYQVRLSNKDENRRALVKIRIDGRSVTSDGLILRAGEKVNLERFLDSGSRTKGKKFKFVPKAEQELRPDNPHDGMIFITVQYEKSTKPLVVYQEEYASFGTIIVPNQGWSKKYLNDYQLTSSTSAVIPTTVGDIAGVTVEGGDSIQRFQEDSIGELEDRIDMLTIELVGYFKTPPILLNK